MSKEINRLLREVARRLDEGMYIDGNLIETENLPADTTIALWAQMATIIKGYLALSDQEQMALTLRGILGDVEGMTPDIIEAALAHYRLPHITQAIAELGQQHRERAARKEQTG